MTYQKFFVNRSADTSADTLLAIGWAAMLREVCKALGMSDKRITIRHQHGSYEITLTRALREEQLVSDNWIAFLDPLISAKQNERQAKKGRTLEDGFDYEEQRGKQKQMTAQRKLLDPRLRSPDAFWNQDPKLMQLRREGPRQDFPHYQAINMMKVPDTFNAIVLRWRSLSAQQQWLVINMLFRLFSQPENDVEGAAREWERLAKEQGLERKASVTAVQVINPTTGKGSNAPKSDRLNSGGVDSFWLLELLKFKGFMLGAMPYVLRGSKDRKTYVIQPATIALGTLERIMDDFRAICWSSTAIKLDIVAALRLTQVFVKHRLEELRNGDGLEEWEKPPMSVTHGFDVAFYKDMGSAHATMNVSTINVPSWFPRLKTLTQVEAADELLQEHLRIIRRIEGHQGKEGNEELELLRTYRDFLSGHDLSPFWTFAALYGSYLFRQREHEKSVKLWLPQLTKKGLDNLVMSHQNKGDLSPITRNRGFQHIASAIREATVRAQRRYTQENDNRYEVRYGLGQELIRKARYRDDFANALNEFLFLYNMETAREEEKVARRLQRRLTTDDYRQNHLRYPVTTADIDQLNELLDQHPTELIAKMLISYGYARLESISPEEIHDDTSVDDTDTSTEEDD